MEQRDIKNQVKKRKKRIVIHRYLKVGLLGILCGLLVSSSNIYAGGWTKQGEEWYYYKDGELERNNWIQTNDEWYHTSENGTRQKGWNKIDGQWYYLKEKHTSEEGWNKILGKWYYLQKKGKMETGWKEVEGKRYYLQENGSMATGWQQVEGEQYYLQEDGSMATGWQNIEGKKYLLAEDGVMKTGWQEVEGKQYLLQEDGSIATGWQEVDGKRYFLSENGMMETGWQLSEGKWYYLQKDGSMKTGWYQDQDNWYHLQEDGSMATGWIKSEGSDYYLNKKGVMKTGWLEYEEQWYYLGVEGKMRTGWQELEGAKYYFNEKGAMCTGWQETSNGWFYFKKNGKQMELKQNSSKFIAHRGLSSEAPENTIPAFELAGKYGFWGIECDLWETSDGQFVITHEDNLKRLCGIDKSVTQMTLQEVKAATVIGGKNIEQYAQLRIPTLEEYLQVLVEYPAMQGVIELKHNFSSQSIQRIVDIVQQYNLTNRVNYISFNRKNLEQVRGLSQSANLQLLSMKGDDDTLNWCRVNKADISVYSNVATPTFVQRCHEANIRVGSWTINNREMVFKQIDLSKVDYITTDNKLF